MAQCLKRRAQTAPNQRHPDRKLKNVAHDACYKSPNKHTYPINLSQSEPPSPSQALLLTIENQEHNLAWMICLFSYPCKRYDDQYF